MGNIVERLSSIINTPERYEIAIDIYDNFNELMWPIKERFFEKIKEKVKDKFELDENKWCFFYHEKIHFCLFKRSWQFNKSDRGIYSFILHNNEYSGLVRNKKYDQKNLTDEEQSIISKMNNYAKGMHICPPDKGWWLYYKPANPFSWSARDYEKVLYPDSMKYKSLVDECVERIDDLLTMMKETNLEQSIDECIEARKKANKI